MHRFPIQIPASNSAPPPYQKPIQIARFSFDEKRQLLLDSDAALRYYKPAKIPSDLGEGLPDKYITKDPLLTEHLDPILASLRQWNLVNRVQQNKPISLPNIITWRGIMTKLMCLSYSPPEPLEFGISLFKGTLYIEEHAEERKQAQVDAGERQQKFMYYGYKFEAVSTYSKPPKQELSSEDENTDVNTNVEHGCVLKTSIGDLSLIIGAEVDCIVSDDPMPSNLEQRQNKYVELKTNRVLSFPKQRHNFFKGKMLRIWAQSYLAGIPKVIIGYRDDYGILQHTEAFDTLKIPKIANSRQELWDYGQCIRFVYKVFKWLQETVTVDDPCSTFTLKFQYPFQDLELSGPFKDENVFLNDEYVQFVKTYHTNTAK